MIQILNFEDAGATTLCGQKAVMDLAPAPKAIYQQNLEKFKSKSKISNKIVKIWSMR